LAQAQSRKASLPSMQCRTLLRPALAGASARARCHVVISRNLWMQVHTEPRLTNAATELECGRLPGSYSSASWPSAGQNKADTQTEFEHRFDEAVKRHLPKPGPGGFSRGCFIGWRRADRYQLSAITGMTIDDLYEVSELLGEGGFGKVHAAKHRRTGEVVAIKSLCKDQMKDSSALQTEVEFLKVADHPNVIRYYETFEDMTHLHLVMEMCSGGSLGELIKASHENHGPGMQERDLARVMVQMLRSVAYCHHHSIVHRDLKPQNFIFGCHSPEVVGHSHGPIPISCCGPEDAPLKLVDFGISAVVRRDKPNKRLLTKRAGTDGYMAPEVLASQPYGPSADIFSLGAVMHTMITGTAPKWDLEKKTYRWPARMRWRNLSPEGQAFIARLVDEDPARRPTATEAMQDPWLEAMGVTKPKDVSALYDACISSISRFSQRSKLQRSIMYSMVAFAPLHNYYMERLRAAFLAANKGVSGGITPEEFAAVAASHHVPVDVQALFRAVNSSQTGLISYSEWLAAAAPQAWYDKSSCHRAFDTLDVNGDGFIRASDLCQLLPNVFPFEEVAEEIRCINPTGDGRLAFRDFCALYKTP